MNDRQGCITMMVYIKLMSDDTKMSITHPMSYFYGLFEITIQS